MYKYQVRHEYDQCVHELIRKKTNTVIWVKPNSLIHNMPKSKGLRHKEKNECPNEKKKDKPWCVPKTNAKESNKL